VLLGEILSVLLTPLILVCVLPNRVPDLLAFVNQNTVEVPGVGSLCSFAMFDFSNFHAGTE
jgi:autophagy-related protein 9